MPKHFFGDFCSPWENSKTILGEVGRRHPIPVEKYIIFQSSYPLRKSKLLRSAWTLWLHPDSRRMLLTNYVNRLLEETIQRKSFVNYCCEEICWKNVNFYKQYSRRKQTVYQYWIIFYNSVCKTRYKLGIIAQKHRISLRTVVPVWEDSQMFLLLWFQFYFYGGVWKSIK